MALPYIDFVELIANTSILCFFIYVPLRAFMLIFEIMRKKQFKKEHGNLSASYINSTESEQNRKIFAVASLIDSIAILSILQIIFLYLYNIVAINYGTHYSYKDVSGFERLYYKGNNYLSINPTNCKLYGIEYDANKTTSHIECNDGQTMTFVNGIEKK